MLDGGQEEALLRAEEAERVGLGDADRARDRADRRPVQAGAAKAGTAASTSWSRRSPAERRAGEEAEATGSADMLDSLVSGR